MTLAPAAQIAVLVADDHPLFLEAIARAVRLDARLRLLADLDHTAGVLDAIRRLSPDVAVVGEELDGLRILGAVAQHRLGTRVALMTDQVRPDPAFAAVALGARGYLSRRITGHALCDAVCRIAAGDAVLCDEAQTTVSSEIRVRFQGEHQLLTKRELDVLVLIARGMTYPQIGRRLHLASATVKTYANRAYDRLGARDRLSAVVEATRRGILD
jgi:two-component system nitrate/nitrite response regulator NarL